MYSIRGKLNIPTSSGTPKRLFSTLRPADRTRVLSGWPRARVRDRVAKFSSWRNFFSSLFFIIVQWIYFLFFFFLIGWPFFLLFFFLISFEISDRWRVVALWIDRTDLEDLILMLINVGVGLIFMLIVIRNLRLDYKSFVFLSQSGKEKSIFQLLLQFYKLYRDSLVIVFRFVGS